MKKVPLIAGSIFFGTKENKTSECEKYFLLYRRKHGTLHAVLKTHAPFCALHCFVGQKSCHCLYLEPSSTKNWTARSISSSSASKATTSAEWCMSFVVL